MVTCTLNKVKLIMCAAYFMLRQVSKQATRTPYSPSCQKKQTLRACFSRNNAGKQSAQQSIGQNIGVYLQGVAELTATAATAVAGIGTIV